MCKTVLREFSTAASIFNQPVTCILKNKGGHTCVVDHAMYTLMSFPWYNMVFITLFLKLALALKCTQLIMQYIVLIILYSMLQKILSMRARAFFRLHALNVVPWLQPCTPGSLTRAQPVCLWSPQCTCTHSNPFRRILNYMPHLFLTWQSQSIHDDKKRRSSHIVPVSHSIGFRSAYDVTIDYWLSHNDKTIVTRSRE